MAVASVTQHLPATPEAAWAVMSDVRRFDEWLTMHTRFTTEPPEVVEEGTTLSQVVTVMGLPLTIAWTVETYDPPRSLRITGQGTAGVQVAFDFRVEPADDGCVAGIDAEFVSTLLVESVAALVERTATEQITASLQNLADLLA